MSPSIKCKLIWDDGPAQVYRLTCAYNPGLIAAIKQLIPASDRTFDPASKVWCFSERYGVPIKQAIEAVWSRSEVMFVSKEDVQKGKSQGASQQARQVPVSNDYSKVPLADAILVFAQMLPREALKAAYRVAAQHYHPDKSGGDTTKMAQLNALWSKIEKEMT